jgi:hypothetical protein
MREERRDGAMERRGGAVIWFIGSVYGVGTYSIVNRKILFII